MVQVVQDKEVNKYEEFDNRTIGSRRERVAVTNLPLIDLDPFLNKSTLEERKRSANALHEACVNTGFFYLGGHGFTAAELDNVVSESKRFFTLPLADKMTVEMQGLERPGFVQNRASEAGQTADIKERFMSVPEPGPGEPAIGHFKEGTRTSWPAPEIAPGFEVMLKDYLGRLVGVSRALVRAFAFSLRLPEDYFDAYIEDPSCWLALNYYPSVDPAVVKPTQWSFSPHTDYGMFTVLLQDNVGGLQVRNASGEWIDVPPRPGTFVVNVADLFARWTNDLYVSTLHRGLNINSANRLSAAFFVSPQSGTIVRCLETCQGPGNPARYEPVEAAGYYQVLLEQAQRQGRASVAAETAQRLKVNKET
jgi:isopenicillin N synthase-like dioxygenase